ncbi:hypothetical protein YC2023_071839 [Brassica napus]
MAVTRRNSVPLSTFVSGQKMTVKSASVPTFHVVRFRRGSLRNGYHIQGRQQARKLPNPDTGVQSKSLNEDPLEGKSGASSRGNSSSNSDFDPIVLAFGIGVMINRDSRGHSYFIVRGEILGFMKDEQLRKHLPRMFSLIKNESWGLEDDQIPS